MCHKNTGKPGIWPSNTARHLKFKVSGLDPENLGKIRLLIPPYRSGRSFLLRIGILGAKPIHVEITILVVILQTQKKQKEFNCICLFPPPLISGLELILYSSSLKGIQYYKCYAFKHSRNFPLTTYLEWQRYKFQWRFSVLLILMKKETEW